MTTKRRSRVNSVRPAAVEAPAPAAAPAPAVEQKAVLDDLPERFRQARDEFYDQKDALQASPAGASGRAGRATSGRWSGSSLR